jgi:hypothetical protein
VALVRKAARPRYLRQRRVSLLKQGERGLLLMSSATASAIGEKSGFPMPPPWVHHHLDHGAISGPYCKRRVRDLTILRLHTMLAVHASCAVRSDRAIASDRVRDLDGKISVVKVSRTL